MTRNTVWHAVVACVFLACCNVVTPGVSDAPTRISDQSQCATACAVLHELGCKEGNPIDMPGTCHVDSDCLGPDGKVDTSQACAANGQCMVSCVSFCRALENTGVWLDPACVAKITSCSKVNSCSTPVTGMGCSGPACKVAPGEK